MTYGYDPQDSGFKLTCDTESSGLVANVTGRIDGVDALIALFMGIGAELRRTGLRQVLVREGGHTWAVWSPAMGEVLRQVDAKRNRASP